MRHALMAMPNLKELWLAGTKVTDEGVEKLEHKLANCRILH